MDVVGLVAGAIRMVEAGGAPAITLVGLDFGPAVIAGSSAAALRAGVVLEALWHSEEDRCDIRVKRPAGEDDRG